VKELVLDPTCSANMATPYARPTKTCPKSHGSGQLGTPRWQQHLGRSISTWLPIPICQDSP